ncbi:MAG: PRD domain-containing protein [Vibrio sp.]|uniref:PRD domain-containing protein n=1 Tax=Vibrio sp. TaxID=678 RepID=UPI003F337049
MENKLNIICKSGLISESVKNGSLTAAELISKKLNVDIKSEQLSMMIIHLANAVTRINNNTPIEHALDNEIMSEITSSDIFHFIESLNKSVCEIFELSHIPETENSFLLSNLYALSLNE